MSILKKSPKFTVSNGERKFTLEFNGGHINAVIGAWYLQHFSTHMYSDSLDLQGLTDDQVQRILQSVYDMVIEMVDANK